MSPRYYNGTLTPASTFGLGVALSPIIYQHPRHLQLQRLSRLERIERGDPFDLRCLRDYFDEDEEEPKATPKETLDALSDPKLDHNGDLGWTVEYATAHCYKHLIANRPGVVAAIDTARRARVERKTPHLIFDLLDKALFTNKLKNMVYLRWKSQELHSPGETHVASKDVKRISIELNSTPFEDDDAEIDELLDVLIHQMIHAYFLVCCGKQKEGSEEDGRLLDGLHFGVLLATIREITKDCRTGRLGLIFYAAQRQGDPLDPVFPRDSIGMRRRKDSFIALDAKGSKLGPPPVDGHSHCTHDNRRFRYPAIRNWQVEEYARCIDLDFASKGPTIWDLDASSKELKEYDRLHGSPSVEYVELVWDKKRVIVPRKKVLAVASLKKPVAKNDRYELKVPDCEWKVFKCLYDFLQRKEYGDGDSDRPFRHHPAGPPVIVARPRENRKEEENDILTDIRVFKLADAMDFPELRSYALERLYDCPTTYSDPIAALKELYNAASDTDEFKGKPPHPDLATWTREWLKRSDDTYPSDRFDTFADDFVRLPRHRRGHATTNYLKLLRVYGAQFEKLYHQLPALKEDVKNVVNALSVGIDLAPPGSTLPLPIAAHGWQSDSRFNGAVDPRYVDALGRVPHLSTLSTVSDTVYTSPLGLSGLPPMVTAYHDSWEDLSLSPRGRRGGWDGGGRVGVRYTAEHLRHLYALDGR